MESAMRRRVVVLAAPRRPSLVAIDEAGLFDEIRAMDVPAERVDRVSQSVEPEQESVTGTADQGCQRAGPARKPLGNLTILIVSKETAQTD
jgi:hypothetical protein